jgi:hypothetical protein
VRITRNSSGFRGLPVIIERFPFKPIHDLSLFIIIADNPIEEFLLHHQHAEAHGIHLKRGAAAIYKA